jgi:2-methylisocitrate lyase-like PEP mutase family enzyme
LLAELDMRRPAATMAAHNPLAAKLAAEASFDAVLGSDFELSVAYAVSDANIPSCGKRLSSATRKLNVLS